METEITPTPQKTQVRRAWLIDLLLVLILLAGAYLRTAGLFWGEYQYLHPDERFLVWVGTDITPLKCIDPTVAIESCPEDQRTWMSFSDYFDTARSTLNPHNRGHGFYVYGTLPMFITRYAVQWIFGHSGFDQMTQIGRTFSALADLLVVLLVFMVGSRLYDRRVGLLAAAFSAAVVLQIQQSHFFTMDTFINLFSFLAFYFAVRVLVDRNAWEMARAPASSPPKVDLAEPEPAALMDGLSAEENGPEGEAAIPDEGSNPDQGVVMGITAPANQPQIDWAEIGRALRAFFRHPLFLLCLGFGIALGMAVSSKLNAAPMALALPAAMLIRLFTLPPDEREQKATQAVVYLVMAAAVSVLIFRIFQPYAFSGPGFFGVTPNPQWVANIRELRAQSSGDVDFPPAMQWARRSIGFSGQNMVLWGLGLPLGILAWTGFLWAGWRILKGDWQRHGLIWGWTALYFVWQSLALNPTMRYQLPIYPMLTIFAGWAVVQIYDSGRQNLKPSRGRLIAAVLVGGSVLALTYAWAFAFTQVYIQPVTRIAASRWIYQNIPGPLNLRIKNEKETFSQPLPFPYTYSISPGIPYQTAFIAKVSGEISEIYIPHMKDDADKIEPRSLLLTITQLPNGENLLGSARLNVNFGGSEDPLGDAYTFKFDQPIQVQEEQTYYLRLELEGDLVSNSLTEVTTTLYIQAPDGNIMTQPLSAPLNLIGPSFPSSVDVTPSSAGQLTGVSFSGGVIQVGEADVLSLTVSSAIPGEENETVNAEMMPQTLDGAPEHMYALNQSIPLEMGQNYLFTFGMGTLGGRITLAGAGIATEGDWDDGLPLRMDGFDGYGGIYPLDLTFNMYWDDGAEKLERFTRVLNDAEYIVMSSNRQWGSLPRLPERFPMTTIYYRELLGCPPERSIGWCYSVAKPGQFTGALGYDLVETFQSDPSLGPIEINDQFAEEAFTVYDHPKVLVFKKRADYDAEKVAATLGAVDFSQIIRVAPMRAASHPANLMLPTEREAEQVQGGAWAELFDTESIVNKYPLITVLVWYLSVFALGLITYPILRQALYGLPDKGYPLARAAGMLIFSYLSWLAGSVRIPYTRLTLAVILAILVLVGVFLAIRQRGKLFAEIRQKRRYYLAVEGIALAFFLVDLFIRIGNPDLWHPWKGGEKPMDFAYFNAILKSTSFPPYDPWYAGGYLNYYYYGFVFVGTLVKLLGIVPAVAYNLILPTIFCLIGLGAFSLAWNLVQVTRRTDPHDTSIPTTSWELSPYIPAAAAAVGTAVLGNLGIIRMIFQGYERLAAPGGVIDGANLITRWIWALQGLVKTFSGEGLLYGIGDWYWIPSRVIQAEGFVVTISEFPFFTVLYGDPHAHLYAIPITLLALSIALAFVIGRMRWKSWLAGLTTFGLAGLAIGALRPTNTWDFPPYLVLGLVAVGYAIWTNYSPPTQRLRQLPLFNELPIFSQRLIVTLAGMALLGGLSFLLYQPYAEWYGLGYTEIQIWKGPKTPVDAYFTHWGLFLFLIVSWLTWETRQWMASTPASSLRKLIPLRNLIYASVIALVAAVIGLVLFGVSIAWVALPVAAWAGVLLLRPDLPDAKRFVLFLIGTGLVLTLMVEVIVLRGDIGRMNTVFKFYLQVWTLFAISAAAGLGWILLDIQGWLPRWKGPWLSILILLVFGAALYPLMAGMAKVKDRMTTSAPVGLDGMAYMTVAHYGDEWGDMDLSIDYRAIRWMQENVAGSPVIVEANIRNLYRWGSRFSIYTGLPGVVGWEWHQQQQRALVPSTWVSNRIAEIDEFYLTTDLEKAHDFLQKYDVRYIIVGQQERGHYPGLGIEKFSAANGSLWREVYRDGDTAIYEVVQTD